MNFTDIQMFRRLGSQWLLGLLGLNLVATIGASVMSGGPTVVVGLVSLCLAAVGAYALRHAATSSNGRAVFAVMAQGQVAVLVAALAGHAWQIDAHMHFFATMGVLIVLVDHRAILAGAAAVALHHVALNFALPSLVYPDGTDLGRTIMHAVILILATVALSVASWALTAMNAASIKGRAMRQDMVDHLAASLGRIVEKGVHGDFSDRVTEEFEDAQLQDIVEDTNRLLAKVDAGVGEAVRVMGHVVSGNLSVQMEGDFQGSLAEMQSNVNGTIATLRQVVGEINTSSTAVGHISQSISEGSSQLADRATNQAASVEETAAAMQHLTETVQANETSAVDMSKLISGTVEKGKAGRAIAQDATDAMSQMSQNAQKISEIIEVMNEISFQTNLLALNASVEAARAGDAGKGFAVVAAEVRALALRSTDAAEGISKLIAQSSRDVNGGVKLVDQLGTTLTSILDAVTSVSDMATEIAQNSSLQSTSISEINATVAGIDMNTQSTAETAEAYSEESKTLRMHATQLNTALALFHQTQQIPAVSDAAA